MQVIKNGRNSEPRGLGLTMDSPEVCGKIQGTPAKLTHKGCPGGAAGIGVSRGMTHVKKSHQVALIQFRFANELREGRDSSRVDH